MSEPQTAPTRAPEIRVRRLELEFPDAIGPRFFGDSPLLSALLGALSVAFPPGEQLFIESVRHYLPQIEDPVLRRQIYAFLGQEAHHTKAHVAFNAFLDRVGYPASRMEAWVTKRIETLKTRSRPESNLARTAALEHFTAILANAFLTQPEVLESMPEPVAKLWAWHAIEELEHRAVAFDVYQRCVGDEALRVRTMRQVTVFFITLVSVRTILMMRAQGALSEVGAIARGLNLLWGYPGVLRRVIPHYRAYYRPDFHPSETGDAAAIARARRLYLGEE